MLKMRDLLPEAPELEAALMHPPRAEPTLTPDLAVRQVRQFCDLPTKELDDVVEAAKAEVAQLEIEAQKIRNAYVTYTERLTADINRLREGVKLSMATLGELRSQCSNLDGKPGGATNTEA